MTNPDSEFSISPVHDSKARTYITLDNGFRFVIPEQISDKFEFTNKCNVFTVTIKKRMWRPRETSKPTPLPPPNLYLPCNRYQSNARLEFNPELISTNNTRNPPDCQRQAVEKSILLNSTNKRTTL